MWSEIKWIKIKKVAIKDIIGTTGETGIWTTYKLTITSMINIPSVVIVLWLYVGESPRS